MTRLLGRLDAGVVQGHCESRVLESALTLRLLQTLGTHLAEQQRLLDYLQSQWIECSDPILRRIAGAALGKEERPGAAATDGEPGGSEHLRSRRKQILMGIVLGLAAGRIPDLGLRPGDFDPEPPVQSWVGTMMQALEVLYLVAHGEQHLVTSAHVTTLLAVTDPSSDGACEQYVLGYVLALTALGQLPATTAIATRRVATLLGYQRSDGGIPFIASMEVFATATAGLGLIAAVKDRRMLYPAGDFLANQQAVDGGWGYACGVSQTDVDDTSYCMQFLRRLDPFRYAGSLERGERYVVAMQNPDGGFPTFTHGGRSETTMTAAAVNALPPTGHRHRGVVRAGVQYILDHQQADGTFERSWSGADANAIFRSLRAIRRGPAGVCATRAEAAERSALDYLRRSQNEDGGWGQRPGDPSDPLSSAYSLIALGRAHGAVPVARGLGYLLDQQRSHGGYVSRPDALGPRPLAYDVPVLAESCVLMAYNEVLAPPVAVDAPPLRVART